MKYLVTRHYTSSTLTLVRGKTVDLDPELAAWVERDCAGTLEEVKARAVKAPPKDRAMKAPKRRRRKS